MAMCCTASACSRLDGSGYELMWNWGCLTVLRAPNLNVTVLQGCGGWTMLQPSGHAGSGSKC